MAMSPRRTRKKPELLHAVAKAADRLITEFWAMDPTLGPDVPWKRLTALTRALGRLKESRDD